MTKYLRVEMPDGSKWDVPAEVIAKDRANYYSHGGNDGDVYDKEYKYTLNNNEELEEWAVNNMNWEDVEASAIQVIPSKETDFDEGWISGDKEVIYK